MFYVVSRLRICHHLGIPARWVKPTAGVRPHQVRQALSHSINVSFLMSIKTLNAHLGLVSEIRLQPSSVLGRNLPPTKKPQNITLTRTQTNRTRYLPVSITLRADNTFITCPFIVRKASSTPKSSSRAQFTDHLACPRTVRTDFGLCCWLRPCFTRLDLCR